MLQTGWEYLTNIKRRLREHKNGLHTNSFTPWTSINKVIALEEIIEDGDEKTITLDYMKKYGWENVRGYSWSQWNMKGPPKELQ